MRAGLYLRSAAREARGAAGRLAFFVGCLAVGVAAVVAVSGVSAGVEEALRNGARALLAADVAVEGHRSLPEEVGRAARELPGARVAEVRELPTMASVSGSAGGPGPSALVELKAVDAGYPFYGALRLDPPRPLDALLQGEGAVAAPELLRRLGLRVGDRLRLGGADFRISGTVLSEPDRTGFFQLGPRVFVSLDGLRRAGLEGFGSRVEHRLLVALPQGTGLAGAEAAAARLGSVLSASPGFRVETYAQAQPRLRRALDRGTRFLGLVALLSLLIAGVGVAQTVRSWLADRMDAIAVLKCLGTRPREILCLYLGETLLIALAGSLAGAACGTLVQFAAAPLVAGLLPSAALPLWQPAALARGAALGVGVALLFSVPILAVARRVPPLRVIRRDAEPLPPSWPARVGSLAVLGAGVFAGAWVQSGSPLLAAEFTAGIAVAVLVLAGAAVLATRLAARVPERVSAGRVWLRHGLAALARPGAGTLGAMVGLGLGVLLVTLVYLVESELHRELVAELPTSAPTAFLVDVQPDQWPDVRALLQREGATQIDSVPVVMARLRAVDGAGVETLAGQAGDERRRRWVLTREQRLTYLPTLPAGNAVVAGTLWTGPYDSTAGGPAQVSVEKGFAEDLGVGVGSTLTFDVQGVPVTLLVTSIRTVEWRTFGINFFLVVQPGVLEAAPQLRLAAAQLPVVRGQGVQDLLAARFPNVTFLDVREILEKVVAVVDRVALGVQFVGAFTVAAGIAILGGAVSAGSVRRGRDVAILKTLGMTRWGVVSAYSLEYGLVGAVAGAIGAAGAGVASWAVLTQGMEAGWSFRAAPYLTAVAGSTLLAVVAGIAASAPALRKRPAEVLRGE